MIVYKRVAVKFYFRLEYVQKYLGDRPDIVEYEEFINEQMKAFDEREELRQVELEKKASEPDADGFVTVVNKRPVVLAEEDQEDESRNSKKKKSGKELPNFYGDQVKTQRLGQLEDLQRKFEEDKRRLQDLKKSWIFQ